MSIDHILGSTLVKVVFHSMPSDDMTDLGDNCGLLLSPGHYEDNFDVIVLIKDIERERAHAF